MIDQKKNLLGLTEKELCDFADSIGESRYRGKQLFEWLYGKSALGFEEMSNLGREFRADLASIACIDGVGYEKHQQSPGDGTTKFLFRLHDGLKIETVLISPTVTFGEEETDDEEKVRRQTLCISTQAGCPLDCAFCATASMGFLRNLTSGEIIDQVLQVKRITGRRVTNVVFMGMGEPLLNYDNVMNAAEIFTAGLEIAARRVTISTAGLADRIRQMGDEKRKARLAVSLHSAIDEVRTKLMPINRKFNIAKLTSALEYYYSRTKQRVTFEYIFFDGVNEGREDIARLVKLTRRVPSKVNVIPYHSIASTNPVGLAASLKPSRRLPELVDELRRQDVTVFLRASAGVDIDAACGQLAVGNQRRSSVRPEKTSPRKSVKKISTHS